MHRISTIKSDSWTMEQKVNFNEVTFISRHSSDMMSRCENLPMPDIFKKAYSSLITTVLKKFHYTIRNTGSCLQHSTQKLEAPVKKTNMANVKRHKSTVAQT